MEVKHRTALDLFTQVSNFIDSSPAVPANPPEGYADQVQSTYGFMTEDPERLLRSLRSLFWDVIIPISM